MRRSILGGFACFQSMLRQLSIKYQLIEIAIYSLESGNRPLVSLFFTSFFVVLEVSACFSCFPTFSPVSVRYVVCFAVRTVFFVVLVVVLAGLPAIVSAGVVSVVVTSQMVSSSAPSVCSVAVSRVYVVSFTVTFACVVVLSIRNELFCFLSLFRDLHTVVACCKTYSDQCF